MDKKLKKDLWARLSEEIVRKFPTFQVYSEKSDYIWPGDLVLLSKAMIAPKTAFLIIQDEKKGRNAFTADLAWSSSGSFPELPQRPSGVPNQYDDLLSRDKAAVRLFRIRDANSESWIDVDMQSIDSAVVKTLDALRESGLPYLERVSR